MSRKVLFINKATPIIEEQLTELGFVCEYDYESTKEALQAKIKDYFGIVMRSRIVIDRDFIDAAVNLSFIAREGAGVEHIATDYAIQKGVRIITSPEGSRDTVGEHTIGLLLGLMNNLTRADRQIRTGEWIREGNRGHEIKGKVVGIVGYGNMGTAFAKRLKGFDCKVIAYDKFKEDYGDGNAAAVDLSTLFAVSDIVSLHIPYTEENFHFVNDAFLSAFKKPIYLVNTARGTVLNTADLVKHLKTGKVLGAALDVLEYEDQSFEFMDLEQMPDDFKYLTQADNVVLSPHIAGWSSESKIGHPRVLAQKIKAIYDRPNPAMVSIFGTDFQFPHQKKYYKGKVRDVYTLEEELIMVATDRISSFDHILPKPIPYKGQVLNQLAAYFLNATADIAPNWLKSTPDPNVAVGIACDAFPIEMVIRGYLVGHAWREYKSGKRILCGVRMPDGMKENEAFPQPIITPATKAAEGHDEDISKEEILARELVTPEDYAQMEKYTYALFQRGTEMAAARGLILVDTKYEFGKKNGKVMVIDEIHTPDSSRYFLQKGYQKAMQEGTRPQQLSKEFVREWLMTHGFQGLEGQQMPEMPDDFVWQVSDRYCELYRILTGKEIEKTNNADWQERIWENVVGEEAY